MTTITFAQLLLAVSIPTLVSLIGIIYNNNAIRDLRADLQAARMEWRTELNNFRQEVRGDLKDIRADLKDFFRTITELESRTNRLEEKK